jgi:predicted nucleotidyltransferase
MEALEAVRVRRRDDILHLAAVHGCRNVRVFGSVATGRFRPASDFDFLVDLEPHRNLFDLGGFQLDIHDLLDADVDVVEARCLHPFIRDRVLAEAVSL